MRLTRTTGLLKGALMLALAFALVAAGCGGDDDDGENGGSDDQPTATTAPADDNGNGDEPEPTEPADDGNGDGGDVGGGDEGGTITVGGESWTVVPDGQCDVFPGPVVYIWGHAAENPDIEITIDYEPEEDFVSAHVSGPNDDPNWRSSDDEISMELDGRTLRGEGTFMQLLGGETAEGSFEVSCD